MNKKRIDIAMLKTARIWGDLSYCERAKVGAVISSEGRIISNGFNGTIANSDNCCEDVVQKAIPCQPCQESGFLTSDNVEFDKCGNCKGTGIVPQKLVSKNTVVHAEANAILFAVKSGIKTKGSTMYVTLSPCIDCAKMIIQAGIKRVVYSNKYRGLEGIEFLKENGIKIKFVSSKEHENV